MVCVSSSVLRFSLLKQSGNVVFQAMDITPDKIALRTAEFYQTHDITVKTDKEVSREFVDNPVYSDLLFKLNNIEIVNWFSLLVKTNICKSELYEMGLYEHCY